MTTKKEACPVRVPEQAKTKNRGAGSDDEVTIIRKTSSGNGALGGADAFDSLESAASTAGHLPGVRLGISTHKKPRCENQPQSSCGLRPDKWDIESPSLRGGDYGFSLSDRGMVVHGRRAPGNPDGKGAPLGQRGKIGGWSYQSRKRMRAFLYSKRSPDDFIDAGVTLTVPCVVHGAAEWGLFERNGLFGGVHPQDIKYQFELFKKELRRLGWCAVWRMEVQERGVIHYHLLVSWPESYGVNNAIERIKMLWYDALDRLPPPAVCRRSDHVITAKDGTIVHSYLLWGETVQMASLEFRRSMWPQARDWVTSDGENRPGRAVQIEINSEDSGAVWYRYLCDHASKTKQHQVAENLGRHWGVVNKSAYVPNESMDIQPLNEKAYFRVVRWLGRLRSPLVYSPRLRRRRGLPVQHSERHLRSDFHDCKIQHRARGCYSGSRVFFGNVETYKRMILQANELEKERLSV